MYIGKYRNFKSTPGHRMQLTCARDIRVTHHPHTSTTEKKGSTTMKNVTMRNTKAQMLQHIQELQNQITELKKSRYTTPTVHSTDYINVDNRDKKMHRDLNTDSAKEYTQLPTLSQLKAIMAICTHHNFLGKVELPTDFTLRAFRAFIDDLNHAPKVTRPGKPSRPDINAPAATWDDYRADSYAYYQRQHTLYHKLLRQYPAHKELINQLKLN